MNSARTLATLFLTAALLAACSDGGPLEPGPEDVVAARTRWAEVGLSDYDMAQAVYCFCLPPREWTNHVRGGVVTDVTVPSAAGLPPDQAAAYRDAALAQAMSVPEALDYLEGALSTAEVVTFELGPTGAPARISVDGSRMIADDEFTFTFGPPVEPAGAGGAP